MARTRELALPRRSQPQGAARLRDPFVVLEFVNPGAGFHSLDVPLSVSGAALGVGSGGQHYVFSTNGHYVDIPYRRSFVGNEWTVVALVRSTSASGAQYVVNQNYNGSSVPISLALGGTPEGGLINGAAVFSETWMWSSSGIYTDVRGDGKWHVVAGRASGAGKKATIEYWLDGRLDSSAPCNRPIPTDNTNPTSIGCYKNDVASLIGDVAGALICDVWLDDEMMVAFGRDFWATALAPITRRIRTPAAAPSGVPDITAVSAESILSDRVSYRATLNYA